MSLANSRQGTARITFGGGRNAAGAFTVMGTCKAGASGESGVGTGRDWGYCVLPEDPRIKQIPYTPPLVGCEAERFLKPGAKAWIVGFGTTESGGGGSKRQVEVMVNALDKRAKGTVDVGDAKVGACHGDSGGPIYLHLQDGASDWGFRVFGSTSGPGAAQCDCSCSTTYVNIAVHIKQIETTENIDVTPCTDANGAWAPGPECNALITNPASGSGTFPNCTVGYTNQPIASCGTPAPTAGGGAAGGPMAAAGQVAPSPAGSGAAVGGSGAPSPAVTAPVTTGGVPGVTAAPIAAGGGAVASVASPTAGTLAPMPSDLGLPRAGNAGQGSVTNGVQGDARVQPAPAKSGGCATVPAGTRGNDASVLASMLGCAAWLLRRSRLSSRTPSRSRA